MKAILADVRTKTVSEINIKDWRDIGPAIRCRTFCCPAEDETGNTLYADDEGLLVLIEGFVFAPQWHPTPLAGSVLFLGTDKEGEACDCSLTVEELQKQITFLSLEEVRAMAGL